MLRNTVILLLILSITVLAANDQTTSHMQTRERNKAAVERIYKSNLKKYKGNTEVLVLPGLLADRGEKRVMIQAEAIGIGKNEPVEFFLIAENSGHDYETLAVSFAKPSDIHKALIFIGMEPGKAVNYKKFRFWPKGERVRMTFAREEAIPAATNFLASIKVEKLILDERTRKHLPETGLVFVGSVFIDSAQQGGKKAYTADVREPNAIVSNYNEPETVFDVPRQAPQGEVYRQQYINPEFMLPAGMLLEVVMEPEYKDGKKRVVSCQLSVVSCPTDQENREEKGLQDLSFEIMGEKLKLNEVLKKFVKMTGAGHDPFVTLRFGNELSLQVIRELCAILSSIETENGIRIEPPLPGHLYYKAFLPDEEFRDRKKRISQPWELHLSVKDLNVSGMLTEIKEIWKDDKFRPDLEVTDYEVPTPEALRRELDERGLGLPVILVFAQPAVTYGQLIGFLKPVLSTHGIIHVFIEENE